MPIVPVPHVPRTGMRHLSHGKNDGITDGVWMAGLAGFVNMLAGRRLKCLFSKFMPINNTTWMTPATAVCNFRFRTSPFLGGVQVIMLLARNSSTTVHGSYTWTVNGVAQPTLYVGADGTTPLGPDELFTQRQSWVVAGNTVYDVSVTTSSAARIVGVICFETWQSDLDTATGGLPLDVYSVGAPVLDRDITSITDRLWTLYCQQGTHHIHSSLDTGAAQIGTTWKNALDGSTTGYSATAAGNWIWPHRRNTLSGTTVAVTFWAYASSSVGTTAQVRFSNSGGVIATITGIGALGWYSVVGTLSTANASELVVVEINNTDAARQTIVRDYGCYEYTT